MTDSGGCAALDLDALDGRVGLSHGEQEGRRVERARPGEQPPLVDLARPRAPRGAAQHELGALGVLPAWFPVADREVATHLARTAWLGRGATPSEVTARLAERHGLPAKGVRLLPMSDVPVETHVVLDDEEGQSAVHVQQWRHELGRPAATRFVVAGMDRAAAAPGVLDAVREADLVVLAPGDPVLSIGIVLGVPGVRDALRGTSAKIVGITPDLTDLGPSLAAVGLEPTADAVSALYRDLRATWLAADASPADVLTHA